MIADPDKYRGYWINIEMKDGKFIGVINDPMSGNLDLWMTTDKEPRDTQALALKDVHDAIDQLIAQQVEETALQIQRSGGVQGA